MSSKLIDTEKQCIIEYSADFQVFLSGLTSTEELSKLFDEIKTTISQDLKYKIKSSRLSFYAQVKEEDKK